jgi:hypothetical protein
MRRSVVGCVMAIVTTPPSSSGPERGERMLGMDRQHHRLAGHRDRLQAGRQFLARAKAEERGVQIARGQPVEQRIGLILRERQLDTGVLASSWQPGKQRRHQPSARSTEGCR